MPTSRLLLDWCAIAILAVAVTAGSILTRGTARIDNAVYDVLIGLRAAPPSDRIIIVAIDDSSIATLGQWPWPRDIHAQALERLAAVRPAAVTYDLLFTEPSRTSGPDERLARTLRRHNVALPLLVEAPGTNGRPFDIVLPVEPLRSAAAGIGHVALPHDADGEARAALLWVDDGNREWPHLAEVAYQRVFGTISPAFSRARRNGNPIALVPYARSGAFRQVPFKELLAGSVPTSFFKDRIVLVGVTAAGLGDRHDAAGAGILPGIEVQANVLNALLVDRFVRDVPLELQLAMSVLPSLLLLLLFWRLPPARALYASAVALLIMAGAPVLLIISGWWLPPTPALLGLLMVYPLWGWRRLQAVDRAIAQELALFASEKHADSAADLPRSDPAGRRAAQLSHSIAALRDLKRLIADTIEGVSDPVIVTAMNGEILLANGSAQSILAAEAKSLQMLLANSTAVSEAPDFTLLNGRSFSPRRTPLRGAAGEQRGWILLLAEITAIRAAQRDREEALEFLSHDMRAPQTAIVNLLETAPQHSILDELRYRIDGHARRTLVLADDFVQLARLRATAFEPEETDICDALAEAMDAAWPQASFKHVRIARTGLTEPCCVMGEHHALMRALLNLIDNAVKFSPDGAEVHCFVDHLELEGRSWLDVSVEDSGPGVADERLENLFERFGPMERHRAALSAGLGLSYAYTVALRHGGQLYHEPVSPSGARFTIRLPQASLSAASDSGTS